MFISAWVGHTDRSRALALAFDAARRALGWTEDHTASLMGLTRTQLSRQISGSEPMNAWRVAELPDEFQREYDKRRIAQRGGIVLEAPDLSLIRGFVSMDSKTMAKMTTPVGVAPHERQRA